MSRVKLTDLIAPSFYKVYNALKKCIYTHYWLKGGRGSTKSTFAAIAIVQGIMRDANEGKHTNAIIIRRYANTLSSSVVEQVKWAIDKLGQRHLWIIPQAKLEFTYKPTGQKIVFKGADDEDKLKSSKLSKGYFKYIWYEELVQFEGMEKIRSINQSLMRGGQDFIVLYTFNPPKSVRSWVNTESQITNPDRLVHHSTYLTVPRDWLGLPFILEAEHLKEVNLTAYDHEYIGNVTGTGGEVFNNVTIRPITQAEIDSFDRVKRGLDFGFASDPLHYTECHFDSTRRRLFIYFEVHKAGMKNRVAVAAIRKQNTDNRPVTADSAEPRTIAEMKDLGLNLIGAKKGPGSVDHGMKFLEDLEEIIIDDKRCPNTAREFLNYELDKDKEGNFKAEYPDRDNHSIDAIRYALETDMRMKRVRSVDKKKLGI